MASIHRGSHRLFLLLLTAWLCGCHSLPDLSEYRVATERLKVAVDATGEVLVQELGHAATRYESVGAAEAGRNLRSAAAEIRDAWRVRIDAMDALREYAVSLDAIAKAGFDGEQSARAVGKSIRTLASSVGIVPGAELAGVAADTFSWIAGQAAIIEATRSLHASIKATGPALSRIVDVIEQDLGAARRVVRLAAAAQIQELQADTFYESGLRLRQKRAELQDGVATRILRRESPTEDREWLEQIEARLRAIEPDLKRVDDEIAATRLREHTAFQLIHSTQLAVLMWSKAHDDVARAVETKSAVRLDGLVDTIVHVHSLIERWRMQ